MRRTLAFLAVAFTALSPTAAFATVTQPNGLAVPGNSSTSTEKRLDAFFADRKEPINWQSDAYTTPDTFAPRCGFTAEFVLNEAGNKYGIAWYNVKSGTTPPVGSELHEIVKAGATVGTKITGAAIAKSPDYTGGLIGFALIGGQTHYSERKWNVTCTACSPAKPWILSLTYQSKKTPNAYYLAFEDGNVTATDFGNDGDYNDDVFFLTGLTCAGGGEKCDTGQKGICSLGSTSCADGKLTCIQAVLPSDKKCNGLDNDCDGVIDNGPCPSGTICARGACVPECGSGEFKCLGGLVCDRGLCVDAACVGKTCPDGKTCVKGECVDSCEGVKCPAGQFCNAGSCVDPCSFLTCAAGEVCDQGFCKQDCNCARCPAEFACDAASKKCVSLACAGVICSAGSICEPTTGDCVGLCDGVVCPKGQACTSGKCLPVAGDAGVEDTGPALGDASTTPEDASVADTAVPFGDASDGKAPQGCGCSLPGGSSEGALVAPIAALIALAVRRRRASITNARCRRPLGDRRGSRASR